MNATVVIWVFVFLLLIVGAFTLRGAITNSFKDVELKKARARMLRSMLGDTGYRIFLGIVGSVFILLAVSFIAIKLVGSKGTSQQSETDEIYISMTSADSNTSEVLITDESKLMESFRLVRGLDYERYRSISFRNNYRDELPEAIWSMKALESIDLTNNEFETLPLDQLAALPGLQKLILIGNPFDSSYVATIQSKLPDVELVLN